MSVTNLLANLLALWNAVLAIAGLTSAVLPTSMNLTQCGPHSTSDGSQQLRAWLYSSSLINLVASVTLAAAFNATHWFYVGAIDESTAPTSPYRYPFIYRLPFIGLTVLYLFRISSSLYYSIPLLSQCIYMNTTAGLAGNVRSLGTFILFMQCVTYIIIPMATVAYTVSLFYIKV